MTLCSLFCAGTLALAACGGASTSSPVPLSRPTPTPAPIECSGNVIGGGGASAPIKVFMALAPEGAVAPPDLGALRVTPTVLRLSQSHPRQPVRIAQHGFSGNFVIAFNSCATIPAVRWRPTPKGPSTTAIFELP